MKGVPSGHNFWERTQSCNQNSIISNMRYITQSPSSMEESQYEDRSFKDFLDRLGQPGIQAYPATYASLLQWSGSAKTLLDGKRLHDQVIKSGLDRNIYLVSQLIQMYGKCGSVEDALFLFARMPVRDVISWNFIIRACVKQGHCEEALHSFQRMHEEAALPDKVTFLSILAAFGILALPNRGKQLHACILSMGLGSDVIIGTAIISMYGKCGSLDIAQTAFDRMNERDAIVWTALLAVYAHHGHCDNSLQLYSHMQQEGVLPDKITFISILDICAKHAALAEGKRTHVRIQDFGIEKDHVVGTALLNMYGKCGKLQMAQEVCDKMHKRNVLSWTSIIAAHAQHGQTQETLQLFKRMQLEGITPNKVTFISILAACETPAMLIVGKSMHAFILEQSLELDIAIGNALVNMYGKCGALRDSWQMFCIMPVRDVVSWTSMMTVFTQHGLGKEALQLFDQMQREGIIPDKVTFASILDACSRHGTLSEGECMHACVTDTGFESDVVVANALVNMYGRCGTVENAQRMFDNMIVRDVVSWNAIIAMYAQEGKSNEILQLFEQMQLEGIMPDKTTFMIIPGAYANPIALTDGRRIHIFIQEYRFESDAVVGTALITMYGKCGSLDDAQWLFDRMPKRDVISWNAMIAGYAHNGKYKDARHLFHQMQSEGFVPDKLSFSTILASCASQLSLAEGKELHAQLVESAFQSEVIVGNALISMYGKCGNLTDAHMMFEKMSERNIISWNALFDVYGRHGHGKDAFDLFQRMQLEGVAPNESTFVSLLAVCSHAGLIDEGSYCFTSMKDDFGVSPGVGHYACVIDLLGRAGRLDEAEGMVKDMPLQPTVVPFMALLGACRYLADVERGERVANHVFELDPINPKTYVGLSNTYVGAG